MAAPLVLAFAFGPAYAFHDGGAGYCDGCHVMHNAKDGTGVTVAGGVRTNTTHSYLLQGVDQSSTCLVCHAGRKTGAADDYFVADLTSGAPYPANFTPGGDFGWLLQSFGGVTTPRVAHNVLASDFGLTADSVLTAPGGNFNVAAAGRAGFACTNCHDPHGQFRYVAESVEGSTVTSIAGPATVGTEVDPIVASGSYGELPQIDKAVGVYRLLAGKGYAPRSNVSFPFVNDPPVAVAPAVYNKSENVNEVRVAYGAGMSEWCQNCHTNVHLNEYVSGGDGLRHPAGNAAKFAEAQASIYNAYLGTGNLTGTNQYTSLVPFESGETDRAILRAAANAPSATGTSVPDGSVFVATVDSNVMCLSCHRAHASGWDYMVRWNMNGTLLTYDGQYPASGEYSSGRSRLQAQAAYYGRTADQLGSFQRSLCNKCHGKE